MPTTEARPFALIMQTDGGFVLADWTLTTAPHELVGEWIREGARMRPHKVDHTLTAWSDDEALWQDRPANPAAWSLLRPLEVRHPFCGPVVLTGAVVYSTGRHADGLTQDQVLQLIERYLSGKRVLTRSLHIPAQRTC